MSTTTQKIEELETEIAAIDDQLDEIHTASDGRALNDAEKASYNALKAELAGLEDQIARHRDREARKAKLAKPSGDGGGEKPSGAKVKGQVPRMRGTFFASQAAYLHRGKGNPYQGASIARQSGDYELAAVMELPKDEIQIAAAVVPGATSDATFTGPLAVARQASEEFIEMLRPMSVVARLQAARNLQFGPANSIVAPRQTGSFSFGWIGQGSPIPVSRAALDSVTLTPKKGAGLTVLSKEALDRSQPAALALIQESMARDVASGIDLEFVDGAARSATRPGLILEGVSAATEAVGGSDLADFEADSLAMLSALSTANVPMGNAVFIARETTALRISFFADSLGQHPYKAEIQAGRLHGKGLIQSNVLPSTSAAALILLAVDDVLIAMDQTPTIDISYDASIELSDAPSGDLSTPEGTSVVASLFQTDSVGIRTTVRLDWLKRHAACVSWVDVAGVSWLA